MQGFNPEAVLIFECLREFTRRFLVIAVFSDNRNDIAQTSVFVFCIFELPYSDNQGCQFGTAGAKFLDFGTF